MTPNDDPTRAARDLFARNLRRLRRERGLTQEVLSGRSGLMQSYLSEVESGKRNLSLDAIATVAGALAVPIALLFEDARDAEGGAAVDVSARPGEERRSIPRRRSRDDDGGSD